MQLAPSYLLQRIFQMLTNCSTPDAMLLKFHVARHFVAQTIFTREHAPQPVHEKK